MVCWTVFLLVRITMLSAILFSVTVKQFTFLFQVVPCRLSLAYTCTQLGSAGKLGQPLVCSRYLIFSLCVCLLYHALSAYTQKAHFAWCPQWLMTTLSLEGTYYTMSQRITTQNLLYVYVHRVCKRVLCYLAVITAKLGFYSIVKLRLLCVQITDIIFVLSNSLYQCH